MAGPDVKRRGGGRSRVTRRSDDDNKAAEETKRRVAELVSSGMPDHLARQVVSGQIELNAALEKLAQRAEVERMMKEHDLTRALATQVVKGHADLEAFLTKRRFEEHRKVNLRRSVLETGMADGAPRLFGLFGQERVEGVVEAVDTYEATVRVEGEETPRVLHKLSFKYAYGKDDWKKAKRAFRKDEELSDEPQRPAKAPQDRYTCSDKRLFRYVDEEAPVTCVLLEGEVITGQVRWFGRFEFGLEVKGGVEITVFRHALHRLKPAG